MGILHALVTIQDRQEPGSPVHGVSGIEKALPTSGIEISGADAAGGGEAMGITA
jgi:hypothetical protein